MSSKLVILLVDDERAFREQFRFYFKEHTIAEAENATNALRLFEQQPDTWHVVVLDYTLPPGEQENLRDGLILLREILKLRKNIPVIMVTGMGDRAVARQALQMGAYWYLEKPLDRVEAEVLLNSIGRWHVATQKIEDLRAQTESSVSLLELSHAMVDALDIDELLDRVTRHAASFLNADECTVVTINEAGQIKKGIPAWGEQLPGFKSHYKNRSIAKELAASGDSCIVPDTQQEPGLSDDFPKEVIHAFGCAACPQEAGAQAVLYAYFKHTLSPEEMDQLKTRLIPLARLTGMALERLRQDQLNRALVSAGNELLKAQSEAEVYQIVRKILEEAFDVSTFYLAVYEELADIIRFPFVVDENKEYPTDPRPNTESEGGLTGLIIRTGREIDSSDISNDPELPVKPRPVGTGKISKAYLGIPLQLPDGRVKGVISIQRYVPRRFLEPPKQALRTLATEVAQTLDRLRAGAAQEHVLDGVTSRPWQDVLREIAQNVNNATGADIVNVHPYDDRRRAFTSERIRLGMSAEQESRPYSGDENRALERLLDVGEHFAEEASQDKIFKGKFVQRHEIASTGGIVLIAGQPPRPVGVLVVNYRLPRVFTSEVKDEIRTHGRQAALVLHNLWMKKREDAVNRRIEAEHQAIRYIRETNDRSALIRFLMDTIKNAWAEPDVEVTPSLMLADHVRRRLIFPEEVKGWYEIDNPEEIKRDSIAFGEGICGWVAVNKQSLLVADVTKDKDKRYIKLKRKTKSELCVPIKLGDSILGVLDVEASQKYFFEEANRIFLERIAEELAIQWGAFGRREDAQKVIDAAMLAARNPDIALNELTRQAFDIAGLRGGKPTFVTVFLATSRGLELASIWPQRYGETIRQKGKVLLPLNPPAGEPRGIVIRTFQTRETQMIRNVKNDPDYIAIDENTQAELTVPIITSDGRPIGVINVEYAESQALGDEDKQLVQTLARQTAVVAVMQKQARELTESQQIRNEATALAFMGIGEVEYGHGWKNAAATVTGTLKLLQDYVGKYQSGWRGRIAKTLKLSPDMQQIIVWTHRALNLTEDLQQTSRMGWPTQGLTDIPVDTWLREQIGRWQEREEKVYFQMGESVESNITIHANSQWLTRALDNLVANAVRACQSSPQPSIVVRGRVLEGSKIRIEILDNGTGVPDEVLPYLFVNLLPDNLQSKFGWGVGCLIAQFIVRAYGGRAYLLETGPNGTTTAIELPCT